MRYSSTAGGVTGVRFRRALLEGLAPDGGLYLPDRIPTLDWGPCDPACLGETAGAVLGPYLGEDLSAEKVARLTREALDFETPLVQLDDRIWLLELFRGPTLAFKDVAARTMARLMARLRDPALPLTVLVATSGDTGSAVAQAFHGVAGTRVVVLYPAGRVSPLQERQLATLGGNITALAVAGAFDDCQRLAKTAFGDDGLRRTFGLTSANSINIGRLIPQMAYWVQAALQLGGSRPEPLWCVPSGNFGNLTAGLMAWRGGLPAAGFEAACNANDVVPEYLETGRYRPRAAVRTWSNAMDVGDPSNLARIEALFEHDLGALRRVVSASRWTDDETLAAMAEVHRRTGRVLDPHTAVGWLALRRRLEALDPSTPGVLLATAHPAKFSDAVRAALGLEVELPERLGRHLEAEILSRPLANDPKALTAVLEEVARG